MASVRESIVVAIALGMGWILIDVLVRGATIESVLPSAAFVAIVGFVAALLFR